MRGGNKGLQWGYKGFTKCYKKLGEVTVGDKGLQEGSKGLPGVTKD